MKMKKVIAVMMMAAMAASMTACGQSTGTTTVAAPAQETETAAEDTSAETEDTSAEADDASAEAKEDGTVYKIGICNYVDDASLNQIVENIENQLAAIGEAEGCTFDVYYDNCNADTNVMGQIISNFLNADEVDLMVGVATPVAIGMQAATEDVPVVFAAVSDPVGAGLVENPEAPEANITGTSDYLDTKSLSLIHI